MGGEKARQPGNEANCDGGNGDTRMHDDIIVIAAGRKSV